MKYVLPNYLVLLKLLLPINLTASHHPEPGSPRQDSTPTHPDAQHLCPRTLPQPPPRPQRLSGEILELGVWGMGYGVRAKVAVEESLHDSSLHGFA